MPATSPAAALTLGRWIVCDYLRDVRSASGQEAEALRLLSVGDTDYSAVTRSVRNGWGALHAKFIATPIRRALREQTDQAGDGVFDGIRFEYRTLLCRDISGEITGVLAIFHRAGEPVPLPPRHGAFRLTLQRENALAATPDEQHWPDSTLDLMRLTREQVTSDRGETGYWLTHMVHPDDRARVWQSITAGARAANGLRQFIAFDSKSNPSSDAPYFPHLLTAYGVPIIGKEDAVVLIRGFWLQLTKPVQSQVVDIEPVGADVLLRGVLELTAPTIFAWVDLAQRKTVAVSPNWEASGLPGTFGGDLLDLASDDDRGLLEALLNSACTHRSQSAATIEFATLGRCMVRATIGHTTDGTDHLVTVSIQKGTH